jgi:hypothetical protein
MASDNENSDLRLVNPEDCNGKIWLIKFAAFWQNLENVSFCAVKNTVIIVCFAPTACRVLGTISAGDRGIFLLGAKYRNDDSPPVAIP